MYVCGFVAIRNISIVVGRIWVSAHVGISNWLARIDVGWKSVFTYHQRLVKHRLLLARMLGITWSLLGVEFGRSYSLSGVVSGSLDAGQIQKSIGAFHNFTLLFHILAHGTPIATQIEIVFDKYVDNLQWKIEENITLYNVLRF